VEIGYAAYMNRGIMMYNVYVYNVSIFGASYHSDNRDQKMARFMSLYFCARQVMSVMYCKDIYHPYHLPIIWCQVELKTSAKSPAPHPEVRSPAVNKEAGPWGVIAAVG